MTPCPTCGRELGPYARFCGSCGAPVAQQQPMQPHPLQQPMPQQPVPPQQQPTAFIEPQTIPQPQLLYAPQPYTPPPPQPRHRSQSNLVLPIVATAGVVALIAAGVVVFVLPRFQNSAQPGPSTVATAPPSSSLAPTTTTETTTTTTVPTTTTPTAATAADLAQEVATDHNTAETLVGQWVPQISSKKLGLVVNGVTFGYPEIAADFQSLKARFPQAILVNSDDYANFSGKDFWVTMDATTFGTADEANQWCDQQGFAQQDCYASRLMHTGGPAGNSKTR